VHESKLVKPRWGSEGRDRKAQAILATLVSRCGEGITAGSWRDIGCGSGGIACAIAPKVRQMTGIDPEPWPNWAAMASEQPNLSFTVGGFDSEHLPLPENAVDVVICNQVYELVARPEQLIRNIHRVLKPGGVCYFAGPNLLWPIEPHVFWPVVHWLPRETGLAIMRWCGSTRVKDLDAFSSTAWTLKRWFADSGLSSENAVCSRLAVQSGDAISDKLARSIARLPNAVFRFANPVLPGFVYLLRRPYRG